MIGLESDLDHDHKFHSKLKPVLVYVTPEKLQQNNTLYNVLSHLYRAGNLERFVIDKAHCISTWDDFQDAASITITWQVIFRESLDRPNLRYIVKSKQNDIINNIINYISREHASQSGIAYCTKQAETQRVANQLVKNRINARHYHAQLSDEEQESVQEGWTNGDLDVGVAMASSNTALATFSYTSFFVYPSSMGVETHPLSTRGWNAATVQVAFGMGIDKPNVILKKLGWECSFIVIPDYHFQDLKNILNLAPPSNKGSADEADLKCREDAVRAVSINPNHKNFTLTQIVAVFRGAKTYSLKPGHGAGSKLSRETTELLFDELLHLRILEEKQIRPSRDRSNWYLKLGPHVANFLAENHGIILRRIMLRHACNDSEEEWDTKESVEAQFSALDEGFLQFYQTWNWTAERNRNRSKIV
ncbi:hypothetical protein B0H19DRAFT_1059584 [Mycena capillaripes]|nr:hypothetical protein B0H19DRAFT_1059584 [Mycena capillaripes]